MSDKTIRVINIVNDIRGGMDKAAFIQKYQISPESLSKILKRLVKAGALKQAEVNPWLQHFNGSPHSPISLQPTTFKASPLLAKRCPKCGYQRQPKDDGLVSETECPQCGVIYQKYEAFIRHKQAEKQNGRKEKGGKVSGFIKGILDMPFKYAEKRGHLKQFKEVLRECLSDGVLTSHEMKRLRRFCTRHNLDLQEALTQSKVEIEFFLHAMLTEIVSDNIVREEEETMLRNVCQFLNPSAKMRQEIWDTIERVKLIQKIKRGDVQPISQHNLVTEISKMVWYHQPQVQLIRELKKSTQAHTGEIYVTSERIIFKSFDYPVEIPLKKLVEILGSSFEFYTIGKTKKTTCHFYVTDGILLEAYVEQALDKFYRKLNLKQTARKTRSIPQHVKQAVWIRDGGQCVECGASEYLEFDHIIPFSKEGSNSEQNIQLLCRKCNLKKHDRI